MQNGYLFLDLFDLLLDESGERDSTLMMLDMRLCLAN